MGSEYSFQAAIRIIIKITQTTKYQQIINYKQYINLSHNSFLTVLDAIKKLITNGINTIREKSQRKFSNSANSAISEVGVDYFLEGLLELNEINYFP